MQVSTVKMYACMSATRISKSMSVVVGMIAMSGFRIVKRIVGSVERCSRLIMPEKERMILSSMCPAIMLMQSRKHRLIGRMKKEMISIGMMKRVIGSGRPEGTNIFKKESPFSLKPIMITLRNAMIARYNVRIN